MLARAIALCVLLAASASAMDCTNHAECLGLGLFYCHRGCNGPEGECRPLQSSTFCAQDGAKALSCACDGKIVNQCESSFVFLVASNAGFHDSLGPCEDGKPTTSKPTTTETSSSSSTYSTSTTEPKTSTKATTAKPKPSTTTATTTSHKDAKQTTVGPTDTTAVDTTTEDTTTTEPQDTTTEDSKETTTEPQDTTTEDSKETTSSSSTATSTVVTTTKQPSTDKSKNEESTTVTTTFTDPTSSTEISDVSDAVVPCEDLSDNLAECTARPDCSTDTDFSVSAIPFCRAKQCSDYGSNEAECTEPCNWSPEASVCLGKDEPVPCPLISDKSSCSAFGHCKWWSPSKDVKVCVDRSEDRPCWLIDNKEDCQEANPCSWEEVLGQPMQLHACVATPKSRLSDVVLGPCVGGVQELKALVSCSDGSDGVAGSERVVQDDAAGAPSSGGNNNTAYIVAGSLGAGFVLGLVTMAVLRRRNKVELRMGPVSNGVVTDVNTFGDDQYQYQAHYPLTGSVSEV